MSTQDRVTDEMVAIGSRWSLKSNYTRVATVTEIREGYLRFKAPWMKGGEGGKALDAFLAHYNRIHREDNSRG